ncbi:tubulin polyglutamylase TTLL7-like isoform X4 [Pecten maximus]|uniref:tubulin polyglutamylase TTLL7-like isoform X4 n=1 Tax=Pecten maximus TaxID=6579 RepID=UPI001458BA4D|nr:tubulin polyglutamylase TTLL7-like isoform X4 [Pecten maximus]
MIRQPKAGLERMPGMKPSSSVSSLASTEKQDVTLSSLMHYTQRPSAKTTGPLQQTGRRHDDRLDERQQEMAEADDRLKGPLIPKKKRKKKSLITVNLSGTRYDVIRQMSEKLGYAVAKDDDPNSYLFWNDCFVATDRISEMKSFQRINHFPGMGEITRKDCLARNMAKVQKQLADDFSFAPKTWILPADHSLLLNYAKDLRAKKKTKTFIIKPSNGAQGHGIQLFRNAEKIPQTEHFIVQEYIDKPLLMDGYKFDLRLYVLVTSCDPLRVFLFDDGLVRLSTEKYLAPTEANINHSFMHLTNYSVNKHNEFYEKGESLSSGSKRSVQFFREYLRQNDINDGLLWQNIGDMIVKTLIVSEPHLLHAYRMCRPGAAPGSDSVCFEVLGFDVLIDRKLRPWLLEVNRSPSFGTDERVDYDIKSALIEDTIRLLNIKISDKSRNMAAQKAEARKRLFRQNKRTDGPDITEYEKKRQSIEKRKEELKETLARIRKVSAREDYENRNRGRFRRIFPPDDKIRHERYVQLLSSTFGIFMSGKAPAMQKEIQRVYNNKLKEVDVMDMLAECEADEKEGKYYTGGTGKPRGPKPLLSMPVSVPSPLENDEDEDEEMEDEETESMSASGSPSMARQGYHPGRRPGSSGRPDSRLSNDGTSSTFNSRPNSGVRSRPTSNMSAANQRSRSLSRTGNGKHTPLQRSTVDDNFLLSVVKEREDELTRKTLVALNEMRIKFPGKSDQEAEYILDKLHENWKFHKPRIASYWLVKLDSIKRRKVIDIVRSNVRAVLLRTWRVSDVDSLKVYRIFNRVFNRLLWSHGQGLWNCFSSSSNATSWEAIFSKSSENICEAELNCCRRIVQLCRDCLLIVYQFAAEAKSSQSNTPHPSSVDEHSSTGQSISARDKSLSLIPPNTQTMSQKYSKLYPATRTPSMGS